MERRRTAAAVLAALTVGGSIFFLVWRFDGRGAIRWAGPPPRVSDGPRLPPGLKKADPPDVRGELDRGGDGRSDRIMTRPKGR